jgi:valyl-tRNA synthetase
MKPLAQQYNHLSEEKKWQQFWEESKVYNWDESASREESFVIDTPPPTVSGLLHMGHIFSYTQADFIGRFQRMLGKSVFYPMGFDDNGLPTERLVEKVKNVRAVNMPRQEFIAICQDVVKDAEEEFRKLFRSVALSVDWSQEYQTINENSRTISQMSFLDLYKQGNAYRQLQPTLWDPIDQTALAQADIVDQEMPGVMNDILFSLEDGKQITIATTRPELIPACVAVFCHPEDKRYQHLIGKKAITPLFGVTLPIIGDTHVDMEKGSGLVMCSTFGDITDMNWWRTYKLPTRVIVGKNGRLCDMDRIGSADWPSVDKERAAKYAAELTGLKIKEARAKIIEMLKAEGLLTNQTEIMHSVKCAERSGSPLEILVNHQWFIKVLDKKEALLKRAAECNWYPPYMKTRVDNWINGLNWDWCISRQRFFGVPFPIWYSKRAGEEGKILTPRLEDLPVDPIKDAPFGYTRDEVEPDMDVMDTWATSSVSPQLNSHAINKDFAIDYARHKKLFPADLRPQAHEIIRTWAFYTLVKAEYHEQSIPWKNLMISGWCLAADKTKMSKSKGNVVTPVNLIEEKGADIVRYWASNSRLGADIAYSEEVFKLGKKLVNKIWNASKFASLHLEKLKETPKDAVTQVKDGTIFVAADLWILTRLNKTIEKATKELLEFEYCTAREAIEDFFWNDFCDNYLEIVKVRSYNEQGNDNKGQLSALSTIYHCLEGLLRLFAPYLPHITEEIYSNLFEGKSLSVHARGNWPKASDYPKDENSEETGKDLVEILNVIRKVKAESNVSIKTPVTELIISGETKHLEAIKQDLINVSNAAQVTFAFLEDALETENKKFKVKVELQLL